MSLDTCTWDEVDHQISLLLGRIQMQAELKRLATRMFTAEMAVLENALVFLCVLGVPRKQTRVVLDGGRIAVDGATKVTGEARFCAPWDQPGWVTVHQQQRRFGADDYTYELRQEWNPY